MTAVAGRPRHAPRRSAATAAARRTSASSPAAPAGPTTSSLPGMLHLAMVRSPFAHATITSIDTTEAKAAHQRRRRAHRRRPRREPGRVHQRLADHPRPGHPGAPADRPADRVAFAGEIVAVVVARTAAEARDAAELVDVEYDELPAAIDLKEAVEGRGARAPRPRHQQVGAVGLRLRRGRHRRRRRGGHRQGPHRRRRHRARVPPAAPDPGVHGAALGRRRPDRRADHHVVGHPDPAHPALRAGRHHRRAGVEDPRHRPRRGRRVRRQAAADAGGDDRLRGRPPARQAGQVHRDPQRESLVGRPPRPRPVAEAHAVGREGRHRHRAQGRAARPTSAPTSRSSAAACRCSARSCSTPSTSSRPTTSPARRCSPTRPGPTPTAAPAGPRRRSASSG